MTKATLSRKVLFYRGNRYALNSPIMKVPGEKLFLFLALFFTERGYEIIPVDVHQGETASEYIHDDIEYIIAHSAGTAKAMRVLRKPELTENIKGVILFDPIAFMCKEKIHSTLPIIRFCSDFCEEKASCPAIERGDTVLQLHDNHFFEQSFKEISTTLSQFIDTT
jgi:hypothetical protein